MARKKVNDETEYWLIPKRSSIHQVWCLIDGIKERNVNGRVWNPTLQNDLGVNLKRWGATNDGKNVSPQAIRTLNAFAQYLGFVYIDDSCTPSVIRVTKAGDLFWANCKPYIQKLRNLVLDESKSLSTSDDVKFQMEKLQLTNPLQAKKCTNILLFPFRITLKLLLDLEYLDVEELAMFVFGMKDESQYDYIKTQIENFRTLPEPSRRNLVNSFKATTLGNLALVQAPSTGYYSSICERTGMILRQSEKVNNSGKKISTIRLQDGAGKYALKVLHEKYQGVIPYDFRDDLHLWIEYFGDPNRLSTPFDAFVINQTKDKLFVSVTDHTGYIRGNAIVRPSESLCFSAFAGDKYHVHLFSTFLKKKLPDIEFTPTNKNHYLYVEGNVMTTEHVETEKDIQNKIIEHVNARNFAGEMEQLLKAYKEQTGVDHLSNSSLRGAYFESLFFELLKLMEKVGKVKNVVWNGRYGADGLPSSAPGGKAGTPDIIFDVQNYTFVLELTTMKAKSAQEHAECTSVPDHIKLVALQSSLKVKGIYCAPIIHERITNMMKSTASNNHTDLACVPVSQLLDQFSVDTSSQLLENLLKL